MGIQGLTSFADSIGSLWTKLKLHNTKVVIDGSCLYYHLHSSAQLNCQSGGQYKEFHDITVSFFDSLKSSNVEPLVVLDGAYDASARKLNTLTRRVKDNILNACRLANGSVECEHVLPLLTRRSFMQSMEELGVKFVVCDCEADEEIASLANFLDCPVISSDSDFFIFDLKQGYIPLKYLDCRSKPLTVDLFKSEKLARHLGISKDLLPLFASLLGNDFVSSETLTPFHRALKRIQQTRRPTKRNQRLTSVAYFLSKSNTLAGGLQDVIRTVPEHTRNDLRKALETSVQTYAAAEQESELASYIEGGEVHSSLFSALEPWVLTKFRLGLFPTACMNALTVGEVFLRVQVESFSAVSANQCSLELRRFMYGVLRKNELEPAKNRAEALVSVSIKEWDREQKGLRHYAVKPYRHVQGYGELPRLCTIPDLDAAARRRLCLVLLESNTNLVLSLPADLQLFAASLRYWIIHANPSIEEVHLRALLICCLQLTKDERTREFHASQRKCRSRPPRGFHPSFNLAAQHSFAQWQSVMQEALHLNLLLLEPLPTPKIRQLYDGLLVQDLVSKLESGQRTRMLLPSAHEFETLYQVVTDGIAEKLLPSATARGAGVSTCGTDATSDLERAKQTRDRSPRKKVEVNANVLTANRFGFLDMDNDSSSEKEDDED